MISDNKIITVATIMVVVALGYTTEALIKINSGVKQEREQAARTADTLNWLAHKYANERDVVAKLTETVDNLMVSDFHTVMRSLLYYCYEYDVPVNVALSLIYIESSFNPSAISSTGDYGLLQVNVKIWGKELDIDTDRILNPDYNIETGLKILKIYYDMAGSWPLAVAMYNRGSNHAKSEHPQKLLKSAFRSRIK